MNQNEKAHILEAAIHDFIKDAGYELVELKFYQRGPEGFLVLLVDTQRADITLAQCSDLNRSISLFIDENGLLSQPYNLEVSSPGIDRNLRTEKDFLRSLNKRIRIFLKAPFSGNLELYGQVIGVYKDRINLELDDKTIADVLLSNITKAKQII